MEQKDLPKCGRSGCENFPLVFAYQNWYCGECYLKIKAHFDKKQKEEIDKI